MGVNVDGDEVVDLHGRASDPGLAPDCYTSYLLTSKPPSRAASTSYVFQRRRSKALPTTLTLDRAMAAPATTGDNMPAAAAGIMTTL